MIRFNYNVTQTEIKQKTCVFLESYTKKANEDSD